MYNLIICEMEQEHYISHCFVTKYYCVLLNIYFKGVFVYGFRPTTRDNRTNTRRVLNQISLYSKTMNNLPQKEYILNYMKYYLM